MPHLQKLLACFLVTAVNCQSFTGGLRTQTNSQKKGTMEPWLVGLSALVGFLFIVFFVLIVKRIVSKKDNGRNENVQKREEFYGFDNKAMGMEMEMEMEMEMGKPVEAKLTSL